MYEAGGTAANGVIKQFTLILKLHHYLGIFNPNWEFYILLAQLKYPKFPEFFDWFVMDALIISKCAQMYLFTSGADNIDG